MRGGDCKKLLYATFVKTVTATRLLERMFPIHALYRLITGPATQAALYIQLYNREYDIQYTFHNTIYNTAHDKHSHLPEVQGALNIQVTFGCIQHSGEQTERRIKRHT